MANLEDLEDLEDDAYRQLARELVESPLSASPAEAQGLLCGLLCAGVAAAEERWGQELFGTADQGAPGADLPPIPSPARPADLSESLRALAKRTRREMEGEDLSLTLLLPAEDRPLQERAEGIYDWARGFLLGLGLGGLSEQGLTAQGREVLRDLVEFTRLDLAGLSAEEEIGEADEAALMELQEFLWVAVRLLQTEAGPAGNPRARLD